MQSDYELLPPALSTAPGMVGDFGSLLDGGTLILPSFDAHISLLLAAEEMGRANSWRIMLKMHKTFPLLIYPSLLRDGF